VDLSDRIPDLLPLDRALGYAMQFIPSPTFREHIIAEDREVALGTCFSVAKQFSSMFHEGLLHNDLHDENMIVSLEGIDTRVRQAAIIRSFLQGECLMGSPVQVPLDIRESLRKPGSSASMRNDRDEQDTPKFWPVIFADLEGVRQASACPTTEPYFELRSFSPDQRFSEDEWDYMLALLYLLGYTAERFEDSGKRVNLRPLGRFWAHGVPKCNQDLIGAVWKPLLPLLESRSWLDSQDRLRRYLFHEFNGSKSRKYEVRENLDDTKLFLSDV
jgi:hypothetical protein